MPTNGFPPTSRRRRSAKALALTDRQGHRAMAWRKADVWVVECDDPAFKRRIQRALRKPVWVREDVPGPEGERWSTLVELRPGDPRHARQLFWDWHQLGLRNVDVAMVPAPGQAPAAANG
ncbi:MAG TPA: hypothetical protein VFG86_21120 [Chloroflexota bacterium]|nr:hypothetical protein [Chloroflexota bacterium]